MSLMVCITCVNFASNKVSLCSYLYNVICMFVRNLALIGNKGTLLNSTLSTTQSLCSCQLFLCHHQKFKTYSSCDVLCARAAAVPAYINSYGLRYMYVYIGTYMCTHTLIYLKVTAR